MGYSLFYHEVFFNGIIRVMKIIGISGNSGSGKDVFADYLVSQYGFVKIAFADPMKRICKDVYDFSEDQLWGSREARNAGDPRYPRPDGSFLSTRIALQLLGSEWGRTCYPQTWTDYLVRAVKRIADDGYCYDSKKGTYKEGTSCVYKGVVVSDCRFINEVKAVTSAGGVVVRIRRAGVGEDVAKGLGVGNHDSETEMLAMPDSLFDAVLNVPEGIPQFQSKIDELMKSL